MLTDDQKHKHHFWVLTMFWMTFTLPDTCFNAKLRRSLRCADISQWSSTGHKVVLWLLSVDTSLKGMTRELKILLLHRQWLTCCHLMSKNAPIEKTIEKSQIIIIIRKKTRQIISHNLITSLHHCKWLKKTDRSSIICKAIYIERKRMVW